MNLLPTDLDKFNALFLKSDIDFEYLSSYLAKSAGTNPQLVKKE
jgi:hypothetical protein